MGIYVPECTTGEEKRENGTASRADSSTESQGNRT